jgi:hypothetical protein
MLLGILPISASGQGASSFEPRQVRANELTESRGAVEDAVRMNLLATIDGAQLIGPKGILNRPWDVDGVNYLANTFFQIDLSGEDSRRSIADMLAYVATVYRAQPAGKKAAESIDKMLEDAITQFDRTNGAGRGQIAWRQVEASIGSYGCADLLTPTFWKGFEKGLNCRDAILGVGNEKTLEKLKTYVGKFRKWDAQSTELLDVKTALLNFVDRNLAGEIGDLEGLLRNSKENGQDQGVARALRKKPLNASDSAK